MINVETALQFAIELLGVELRRPETESVLEPVFQRYHVEEQERRMILNHIHTLAPFNKMFKHYRWSDTVTESRYEIAVDCIRALKQLQGQLYLMDKATDRLEKEVTKPLPPLEGEPPVPPLEPNNE